MDGPITRGSKRPFGSIVLTLVAVAGIFVAGTYFDTHTGMEADLATDLYEKTIEVVELNAIVAALNINLKLHEEYTAVLEDQLQAKDTMIDALHRLNAAYETETN